MLQPHGRGDLQARLGPYTGPHTHSWPSTDGGPPVAAVGLASAPGVKARKHVSSALTSRALLLLHTPALPSLHPQRLHRGADHPYGISYHLYVDDSLVYQKVPCPDLSIMPADRLEPEWHRHEMHATVTLPLTYAIMGTRLNTLG